MTKSWPVSYRWLALGTVVIYTAIGSRTVNIAAAQQLPPRSNSERETTLTLQFNIAPGALGVVVPAFENATQLHVILSSEMSVLASPGVSGQVLPGTSLAPARSNACSAESGPTEPRPADPYSERSCWWFRNQGRGIPP